MPNSPEYLAKNKEKIRQYMREYYLAHTERPRMVPGAERLSKTCKRCGEHKDREAFCIRQSGERKGHLSAHCRACMTTYAKYRWEKSPEHVGAIEWRSKIKRRYGISEADYNAMLESQGHACAICRSPQSWSRGYKHKKNGSSRFMVDHCHETGKVRGLLCTRCNRALGLLRDSVENFLSAVAYLKKSQQK